MSSLNAAALGELIEAGLGAETLVEKQQVLPGMGKKDRKILFAAIAEAVLTYLKQHQDALTFVHSDGTPDNVDVQSPLLDASQAVAGSGTVQVTGGGFVAGASVQIRWTEDQSAPTIATADGTGNFSVSVSVPAALRDGNRHYLDARDGQGEAALAEVSPT